MSDDRSGEISRRGFLQASAASVVAPTVLEAALGAEPRPATTTVARYILTRLSQHGVRFLFGVPGATCDPLFASADGTTITPIVTSSDLEAGYAADGYARTRGLGAVSVTYGVGMLGLLSTIAGAYAERSAVVVINGGPSPEDLRLQRELGTFFTHSIGREKTDLSMFREVTEYAERVEKPADAGRVVDAAIKTALLTQRPVYVEIAKSIWDETCAAPSEPLDVLLSATGEEDRLAAEILEKLRGAARPALLLGVEIQRYGLSDEVTSWVQKLGLPWATTLLAKSVIDEKVPGFVGVYSGEHALPSVKGVVEGADALLMLGCIPGRQYRSLITRSAEKLINVSNHAVRFGRKPPAKASLGPLVVALKRQPWKPRPELLAGTQLAGLSFDQRRASAPPVPPSAASKGEVGMTYDDALREVSDFLDETFIAVTDTSLSMYPAAELNGHGPRSFLCNAVWQSIGYSVAAAVGASFGQERRPVVLCGDGGFQMTAQALSTMAQQQIRSVVIVLDNGEYGIEQWLLDPRYFADAAAPLRPYLALNRWDYAQLARAFGFKATYTVAEVPALREALAAAKEATGPALICATLQKRNLPSQLRAG